MRKGKVYTDYGSKPTRPVEILQTYSPVENGDDDWNPNEFWYAGFRAYTPDPGYRLFAIEPPEGMPLPVYMAGVFTRDFALDLIKRHMEGVAKNATA